MNLPNGTLLQGGKYKITRFIASGGFGCTYEAVHVMLGKRVAIKEFFVKNFCNRDEATANVTVGQTQAPLVSKLKKKFIDEASALARFQHPGIVRVSDVFEENGTAYFVMDYIDGISVGEMLKKQQRLPETKAVKYITQVAEVLRAVHAKNRLHLDIKPGNIMVGSDDNAVLIDFGASKQYDEVNGENTSTLVGRTPGYAPLEQLGNDIVKFIPATDIHALGATLYKMLTGKTPLSASLIASGEELEPLPAGISEPVRAAVTASMALNKKNRPQTIDEFLRLLAPKGTKLHQSADGVKTPRPPFPAEQPVDENTLIEEQPVNPKAKAQKEQPQLVDDSTKKNSSDHRKSNDRWILLALLIGLPLFCIIIYYLPYGSDPDTSDNAKDSTEYAALLTSLNGIIDGHEYADLGLSVNWATCNLGADSPEETGNYYAWGETATKAKYTEGNSKWEGVPYSTLSKKDIIDGHHSLRPEYDAATQNWGSSWRMPTTDEFEELIYKCAWEWTNIGSQYGFRATGPNGNSIFLPAGGDYAGQFHVNNGCYYWSATSNGSYSDCLQLHDPSPFHVYNQGNRYEGLPIRPVTDGL